MGETFVFSPPLPPAPLPGTVGHSRGPPVSRSSTPGLPLPPRPQPLGSNPSSATPRSLRSRRQRQQFATIFGSFKKADREIVALDFLLNIPMKNETAILYHARQQYAAPVDGGGTRGVAPEEEVVDLLDSPSPFPGSGGHSGAIPVETTAVGEGAMKIPGRRLDGPNAPMLRVPIAFRYRVRALHEQAAVLRQWEAAMVGRAGLLDSRCFLSCGRGYPLSVSSVIKYKPGVEEDRRLKAKQADERGAEAFQMPLRDWRGTTLGKLLHAEWAPCSAERDAQSGHRPPALQYDPCFLDDPSMVQGKNRQVTAGDSTIGPVVFSVILFVNPKQLKDELNRQFREKHPGLPPSLTLSKIRSLKALIACRALDIEIGTLALACVYFEKLCLKGLVTKSNRRLAFGACLSLAYKFNELSAQRSSKLPLLLDFIDREWFTSNKQVFEAEFGVFYHLDFALHCQLYEVSHHFSRLLKMIEKAPKDYLGEDMLMAYVAQGEEGRSAAPLARGPETGGGSGGNAAGVALSSAESIATTKDRRALGKPTKRIKAHRPGFLKASTAKVARHHRPPATGEDSHTGVGIGRKSGQRRNGPSWNLSWRGGGS